jgi:hypothetical protein
LRIAYFHTELSARGPGVLLRDLLRDPLEDKPDAVLRIVAQVAPDILLVSGLDYDAGRNTLKAFQSRLANRGHPMPFAFAAPPNHGVPTGLDLDNDGRLGEPEDTQGFAAFRGAGGMALLSRFPILTNAAQDFGTLPWAEFPAANLPFARDGPEAEALRLSTSGHWDVPVRLPNGTVLRLLALHAVPPVFDGPEDRNGRRNADQLRFWADYLNGWHPWSGTALPPENAIVLGTLNADPLDGESRAGAVARLLEHPVLQDPRPTSLGAITSTRSQGGVNSTHRTPAAQDTVDWPDDGTGAPGNLRVDYVLPARSFRVLDSGVFWPVEGDAAERARAASRHRLVWVDLAAPPAP